MAIRSRASGNVSAQPVVWPVVLAAGAVWLATAPGVAETDRPPLTGPAPNFALTTQQNDRLWLTQLRGRAVVLAFGCTLCGACPALVPRLADVARGLGDAPGRRVFFVLVTVDPARDTPGALREFSRVHGLRAPAWLLLTEDRAGQVDVVARRYGVVVRRAAGRVEADCAVTLIDPAGQIRARYEVASLDALRGDLRALLGLPASP
jgi:protein SCO1/2